MSPYVVVGLPCQVADLLNIWWLNSKSISKKQGRSTWHFYDLALKDTEHHTLLIERITEATQIQQGICTSPPDGRVPVLPFKSIYDVLYCGGYLWKIKICYVYHSMNFDKYIHLCNTKSYQVTESIPFLVSACPHIILPNQPLL